MRIAWSKRTTSGCLGASNGPLGEVRRRGFSGLPDISSASIGFRAMWSPPVIEVDMTEAEYDTPFDGSPSGAQVPAPLSSPDASCPDNGDPFIAS